MIFNSYPVIIKRELYLYNKGDECIDITGGFSGLKYGTNATFSNNNSKLYLHSYRASFVTNKSIDLSRFNVLKARITDATCRDVIGYYSHIIGIYSNNIGDYGKPSGFIHEDGNNIVGTTTISLDISSYNSKYYISITADDNNNNAYMYVDKIWLE